MAGRALHTEETAVEEGRTLAVFLDDTLAVHQPETALLGQLKRLLIDGFYFVGTEAGAIVGHGYLHAWAIAHLGGLQLDGTSLGGIFSGILSQRVEHEEGQGFVGLDQQVGGRDGELLPLHLESAAPLGNEVEKLAQSETLDMEAQLPLAHLDPVGQDIVVLVDGGGQLLDVVEALLAVIVRGARLVETAHFVTDAVDEGLYAVDHAEAGSFRHVLPLLLGDVTLMHGALLLQREALFVQREGRFPIGYGPLHIGVDDPQHRSLLPAEGEGEVELALLNGGLIGTK